MPPIRSIIVMSLLRFAFYRGQIVYPHPLGSSLHTRSQSYDSTTEMVESSVPNTLGFGIVAIWILAVESFYSGSLPLCLKSGGLPRQLDSMVIAASILTATEFPNSHEWGCLIDQVRHLENTNYR